MSIIIYLFDAVILPMNFSNIQCDIIDLSGDNHKMWKEMVLLQLGWMDIDYVIQKNKPPAVTSISTQAQIVEHEQ